MPYSFRHALCNELYERRPFAEACKSARAAGYTGIEIAPFTLDEDPASVPAGQRREYADAIRSEGLEFVGLHWLLASPKGLQVSSPDKEIRERSWKYVHRLADLCADLGENGVLVFGSPKQRSTSGDLAVPDATAYFTEGLARAAAYAALRGVTILLEALPPPETDVVTSLDEAALIVREADSPGLRTMFDVHNAAQEREPHHVLVDRYFDIIRHVHLNEVDGRHPGTGQYDYKPVLETLARRGYQGWLSLEVFDFSAGPDRIAEESLRYLESEIAALPEVARR